MQDSPQPSHISTQAKPGKMELTPISQKSRNEILYVVERMRDMDRKEIYATSMVTTNTEYADFIVRMAQFGLHGWVASVNNEPIAVVGVSPMWGGVASVCMFATDRFNEIALPMTKFIKRHMIPNFVASAGIHRAQCFSMVGHAMAHSWLRVLGAESEGVARGYGMNGEDFELFAWRF
jgi:hypothetical protein